MAANRVRKTEAGGKPAGSLVEQRAAAWAAVQYLAGKIESRDSLTAGRSYSVRIDIAAAVDGGPPLRESYEGPLTVGEDSEVAASHTPGGDKLLIAVAMSKLNEATRAAVLRQVLVDYAAGEVPAPPPAIVAEVDAALRQVRAGAKTTRRGSVRFAGERSAPPLGLVGAASEY